MNLNTLIHARVDQPSQERHSQPLQNCHRGQMPSIILMTHEYLTDDLQAIRLRSEPTIGDSLQKRAL